uniref:Small ribosomal subunit protein mS23 n=1 Tax=Caligus rogercresseyi TaxID=217165 RepID=C1BPA8_CALRO|nr:Mitochondrial ribosomal protein S23 [Caligus rogercresseyi]|eukprot:TRINITY_DN6847_c0_g1_i1.p1 TRINITY_DN6847_c0_g1~~TRINITY_DN6847_c0_g1_i1.p1  ORF type:complete len:170 (+),score=50.37 TRINITY_DN6847_c0_g1_i1:24-533(+)
MAQSRLEKVGTIYSRMSALIQSGARTDKPLWLDIYESFPPKYEPRWDRKPLTKSSGVENWDRKILYAEDIIRAKFYKHFQNTLHETQNLRDPDFKSISEHFIEAYQSTPMDLDDKSRFLAALDALELQKGINLREPSSRIESSEEQNEKKPQISMKELFLQNQAERNKD